MKSLRATLLLMVGLAQAQTYVLPPPPHLTVPQYTPPPPQQLAPIAGNPGQRAITTPTAMPPRNPGYTVADCKVTPMGTLICRNR
jgi:hypothetical protein